MKVIRILFIVMLGLVYVGQWVTIAHQSIALNSRGIPEDRLIELLEQSHLNERRLTAVAGQNEILTTRTLAILERITPTSLYTPSSGADEPLVLYEAVPQGGDEKGGLQ